MKSSAIPFLVLFLIGGPAGAGTLAGASDGVYTAEDGSFIVVASAENSIGVQFLDCRKPVAANGRLKAKFCWANGHAGGGVDVSWRVEGTSIYSEGKRHVFTPALPPLEKSGPADPFEPTPDAWTHNGSGVKVDPKSGKITYIMPKAALKGVAKPGSLIFDGSLRPGSFVFGTAYAFKEGCPPASYPVRGVYSKHNEKLVLKGPGPKREGCTVVAYSYDSPHSTLVFDYVYGD